MTRTYSIADTCDNVSSCTQVFTVDDITPPVITCPVGITVECFVALPLAYTTYAEFVTAGGSASDNCGLVESTFTLVSQTTGAGICPRTVTRTYSIADTCDNVSICTQVFTVDDITPPVITCPVGITVECFVALPLAYTTFAEFVTAGGTASDNCGLVESTFTLVSQTTGAGICPRTVTRTYSIADTCNNVSSCTQVFTVDDITPPVITCPVGITVECFVALPLAYTTLCRVPGCRRHRHRQLRTGRVDLHAGEPDHRSRDLPADGDTYLLHCRHL